MKIASSGSKSPEVSPLFFLKKQTKQNKIKIDTGGSKSSKVSPLFFLK